MTAGRGRTPAWTRRAVLALTTAAVLGTTGLAPATAAPTYPSDTPPDLVPALSGYDALWSRTTKDAPLHGTVQDRATLRFNDRVDSWVNQHATKAQQLRALRDSQYLADDGSGYDQSLTIADGLGSRLGPLYVRGRLAGRLPLTSALVNSSDGSTGAYESTGAAKAAFSYPRPYLAPSGRSRRVAGDAAACAPVKVNASSLRGIRKGERWATKKGRLKITRVSSRVDRTHELAPYDVRLDVGYGTKGLCTGGSFPSGHTTTAYEAGITLATLLPEVAPEVLARASEAGNNRIVLGVHYPLDVIGGRMDGEIALSARWSDAKFRTGVLEPARAELVAYLVTACGTTTIAACAAEGEPYTDRPYVRRTEIPRGSRQKVTDRRTAVAVYTERLSYGFRPTGSTALPASVPKGSENLLRTAFPGLDAAQRRAVLAQTETRSGHPLDTTASAGRDGVPGSWQRLDLAAAMTATVVVGLDGSVVVRSTGGHATVERAGTHA